MFERNMANTKKWYVVVYWDDGSDVWCIRGWHKTFDEAKQESEVGDEIYEISAKWKVEQAVKVVKGSRDEDIDE